MSIILVALLYLCSIQQWTVDATNNQHHVPPHQIHIDSRPDNRIPYAVVAHFDMNGIRGNVTFTQANDASPVRISAKFDGLDQFGPDERWGWHIHEYPINYGLLEEFPCSTESVGGHFDPDDRISNENYTMDCSMETSEECELGDLSGRFGRLTPDQSVYNFVSDDDDVNLYGPNSFIGRSIVIHRTDGFRWACANIEYDAHNQLETFVARFPKDPFQQQNTIMGEVVLRRASRRAGVTLSGVLYRVDGGPVNTQYRWNLREGTCDPVSNAVWGPPLTSGSYARKLTRFCSTLQQSQCQQGDLTGKCGSLESNAEGRINFFCTDTQLGRILGFDPINQDPRKTRLALVIEEETASGGGVLACSCFEYLPPKKARAIINQQTEIVSASGIPRWITRQVDLTVYQSDPHDPTFIRLFTSYLPEANEFGEQPYLQIRERAVGEDGNCTNLGPVFEPRPFMEQALPEIDGVIQTGDRDFIGEFRNKIPLDGSVGRTNWLPLFRPHSVIGRAVVLHDADDNVVACANLADDSAPGFMGPSLSGYYKK